jgi:type VI protein secretion system component Hcp
VYPAISDSREEADMSDVKYFLKIDGVKGDSTDPAHPGSLDVYSWQWGPIRTMEEEQRKPVKEVGFNLNLMKSRAHQTLWDAWRSGVHFPSASFELVQGGKLIYRRFLHDVMVTSVEEGGASNGSPVVTFVLFQCRNMTFVPSSPPVEPEHLALIHEIRYRK